MATTPRAPDWATVLRRMGGAGAAVAAPAHGSKPGTARESRTRCFHAASACWCSLHFAWRRTVRMRLSLPMPLPRSERHRLPLKAAQNKQTPRPPPACASHVSGFRVTGLVAEQAALNFSLCFQKRQASHVPTCIGKLWLAACSARVCVAPTSNVSENFLVGAFAVAAVPVSPTPPSSEDSPEHFPDKEPSAEVSAALEGVFSVALNSGPLWQLSPSPPPAAGEETESGDLHEGSDLEVPSLVRVAAADGALSASDPLEAA